MGLNFIFWFLQSWRRSAKEKWSIHSEIKLDFLNYGHERLQEVWTVLKKIHPGLTRLISRWLYHSVLVANGNRWEPHRSHEFDSNANTRWPQIVEQGSVLYLVDGETSSRQNQSDPDQSTSFWRWRLDDVTYTNYWHLKQKPSMQSRTLISRKPMNH